MDFEEIKKLIEEDGGKFIIVENDKPSIVITSFEDYKKNLVPKKRMIQETIQPEKKPLPKELAQDELKIEDLPF
jgi:PHD/YefM family antitoxin component YafN of YafNO toxin-antitoxin module